MSGIVGLVNQNHQPVSQLMLEQLTNHLAFRGPEAQHCWVDGAVGFGHALLQSTFDCDLVQQPFNLDGQVWITGDVRIDARAELVSKLQAKACSVSLSTDDIALLLQAYLVWGQSCLDHILGDFGFMIWDKRDQTLFCARDPFGVVPFYYAQVDNGLILSNTLTCIQRHPDVSDTLNENTIGHFLLFKLNADLSMTTFADIHQLPPAHKLAWSDGDLKIVRYFDLGELNTDPIYRRDADYIEAFRELLQQAVTDRLRTSAVGSHLSGGMDSTSVASLALERLKSTSPSGYWFKTYTGAPPAFLGSDEVTYTRQVADWLRCEAAVISVGDRYGEMTETTWPEPRFAGFDPNSVILPEVAAARGIMLTGFGGDALLSPVPYQPHQKAGRSVTFGKYIYRYMRHLQRIPLVAIQNKAQQLVSKRAIPVTNSMMPDWLDAGFVSRTKLDEQAKAVRHQFAQSEGVKSLIGGAMWYKAFLTKEPGYTGFPAKTYHPFFDLRLIYFTPSVPITLRRDKLLLRAAMQGRLPDTVRRRPKRGSPRNLPRAHAELHGPLPWTEDLIWSTPQLKQYVDVAAVWQLICAPSQHSDRMYRKTTRPVALAHWLRYREKPSKINA